MDPTIAALLVILAVAIAAFAVFRNVRFRAKGPLGMSLEVDGGKEAPAQPPGVVVENSKAARNLTAENDAGTGTRVSGSEAGGDLTATNRREPPDPKA